MKYALSEASRCVYCGFCEPACPTLYPGGHRGHGPRGRLQLIATLAQNGASRLVEEALYTCLLCGACTLLCPAKIDVAGAVREARAYLRSRMA
ncbi:MAG: (Fe-S)-binding protein [Acidilobaceae archaeon]|nr:(Fe-S)-binding protein [Acidilobaceae archaeon]MCX8166175.1 (Fe-S)-binding protein [Acidilobaceae archaeon]MDW7974813.1 (Fe-S)-binding protein [Sulfolobales archaeon]